MFYTVIKKNYNKNWWATEIDWKQEERYLSAALANVTSKAFRY